MPKLCLRSGYVASILAAHAFGAAACASAAPPSLSSAAPAPVASLVAVPPGTPHGLATGALAQMGPTGLALPLVLGPQSGDERQFAVAAARALRQIYEEDHDDAALLQALLPRLQAPELQAQASLWRPLLTAGLARAETLQSIAPGLRALRRAYANVYFDEIAQAYRGLDLVACAQSNAALTEFAQAHPEFAVTIEPVGPWPVRKLLDTCRI